MHVRPILNIQCPMPIVGTIERGHIYFFYRPKVELEEAHSLDDVQRFYMLLIPRPPQFASGSDTAANQANEDEDQEMNLIEAGADAVPAPEPKGPTKKHFRLLILGKKALPDPDAKGSGRNQVFWVIVSTVGEDLKKLEEGLGAKTYETKTRGWLSSRTSRDTVLISMRRNSPPGSCQTRCARCVRHRE